MQNTKNDEIMPLLQEQKKPLVPRTEDEMAKLLSRLKKIEGQVRGLQKMVEDERYCIDILVQISAVNAALKKVGMQVLKRHTTHCVADAIKKDDSEETIDELMKTIELFMKI